MIMLSVCPLKELCMFSFCLPQVLEKGTGQKFQKSSIPTGEHLTYFFRSPGLPRWDVKSCFSIFPVLSLLRTALLGWPQCPSGVLSIPVWTALALTHDWKWSCFKLEEIVSCMWTLAAAAWQKLNAHSFSWRYIWVSSLTAPHVVDQKAGQGFLTLSDLSPGGAGRCPGLRCSSRFPLYFLII